MKSRLVMLLALAVGVAAALAGLATTGSAAPKPPPAPARSVYVVSTSNANVVRIDPATLQVVQTVELAGGYVSSIAVAGDRMYYTNFNGPSGAVIGRYNLATGDDEPAYIDQVTYSPILRTSPALPNVLFVGETAQSPAHVQKWSVPTRGRRPTLLARTEHGPLGSSLRDFEISVDGSKLWTASGTPSSFLELSSSNLSLTGKSFPAGSGTTSVDAVAPGGREYLVGGTDSVYEPSVHLYDVANPASRVDYGATGTSSLNGAVILSTDATKIYRVVNDFSSVARIETLSAATGETLATMAVSFSPTFAEGIAVDPVTGNVFVSLTDSVGVLDPSGALVRVIPNVAGAGQVVVAP